MSSNSKKTKQTKKSTERNTHNPYSVMCKRLAVKHLDGVQQVSADPLPGVTAPSPALRPTSGEPLKPWPPKAGELLTDDHRTSSS